MKYMETNMFKTWKKIRTKLYEFGLAVQFDIELGLFKSIVHVTVFVQGCDES